MNGKCRAFSLRTGRFSQCGQIYTVTTVTEGRIAHFEDLGLGRLLVKEMRAVEQAGRLSSLAWVVMPDHLHWLFELRSGSLGDVVGRVKARSGYAINTRLALQGPLWQKGYYDRALRKEEDLRQAARYIIANPLRAGLVQRVADYPLWDAVWL
ncbi:REP-associated tyrosine transposase [Pseudomonas eucalypticola]|uniref:Transposase n=1 Tax=Pseudomonas eucalypticola TaxID=2599595 RepID=A0A7D5D9Z2_9PSED|nr:transposase [Pseudomonas eucalypticola]QKZ05101.1 transposase [Pseudomonas eucalypticola]